MAKFSADITTPCRLHGDHRTTLSGYDPSAWCDANNLFFLLYEQWISSTALTDEPAIAYFRDGRAVSAEKACEDFLAYQETRQ
jgi:hypothetical protein